MIKIRKSCILYFNPRSHERSDFHTGIIIHYTIHFNPRSHERSDALGITDRLTSDVFQSTLPREERQSICGMLGNVQRISIHAPTRGATDTTDRPQDRRTISIHAPTRGATIDVLQTYWFDIISIHAPTRGATNALFGKGQVCFISIHAPTRGATESWDKNKYGVYISIHAPTRGATAILHKKFVYFYTIPTINI